MKNIWLFIFIFSISTKSKLFAQYPTQIINNANCSVFVREVCFSTAADNNCQILATGPTHSFPPGTSLLPAFTACDPAWINCEVALQFGWDVPECQTDLNGLILTPPVQSYWPVPNPPCFSQGEQMPRCEKCENDYHEAGHVDYWTGAGAIYVFPDSHH